MGHSSFIVPQRALDRVRCALGHRDRDLGAVHLVGMTEESVTVSFRALGAPELPLGEELSLSLRIDEKEPLDRTARVASRADAGGERSYQLSLLQTASLRNELHELLIRAFNLRGAFRVKPEDAEPIAAAICLAERGFRADLDIEDISVTGLAGATDLEAEEILCRVDEVGLELVLGPGELPVCVEARIVGRELRGVSVVYRLAFAEGGPAQEAEIDRVVDYIMERQRRLAATGVR